MDARKKEISQMMRKFRIANYIITFLLLCLFCLFLFHTSFDRTALFLCFYCALAFSLIIKDKLLIKKIDQINQKHDVSRQVNVSLRSNKMSDADKK